jgi:phosphoribosylformylglycinamidine synthase PurS subunit
MVRWIADVQVALRPGIADPEGLTIASGLRSLGYEQVHAVRSGKLFRIEFDATDPRSADAVVAEMCRRLLANPVMEAASWQVRVDESPGADEQEAIQ